MRLTCIHHLDPPVLGFARPVLEASGWDVSHHSPYRGEQLPPPAEIDGAIVFGAEQSVRDLDSDPVMQAEAAWLAEAVERELPVLGICFGAQLMARALGGCVERLPRRMLTWDPLTPTAAAAGDPLLGDLPEGARALQWNEDGFEPPPGAVELVRRTTPSCQAFRAGGAAWGVQFHPDVDASALEQWYAEWGEVLAQAGVDEAAARAADRSHLPRQADLGSALFGAFADVVRRRAAERRTAPAS